VGAGAGCRAALCLLDRPLAGRARPARGRRWTAIGDGLPQEHAYLTVLRQAFTTIGEGPGLGLYFGATSGDVFASPDARASWSAAATRLPPVFALTAS